MKLVSVTLNDVRRFTSPVAITGIGPGLNVLSAPNENGKSTLFDALHALFFIPHRSKGKEIKALKPHAGGAPEVGVEIDTDQGRFRIFKRWSSREVAEVWQRDRLVAKADEAEAWISGLTTSGGDGGPAGLLWVRQGMTHLDHERARENQGTLSTRRDLISSVTGEVEALTGGRRMDMALARAQADLAPLLTPTGRPKADGPLAKAEAEVAALSRRQAELSETANRLAVALARRAQIRRDLAHLQDPAAVDGRKHRLAEATAAFEAARRHAEALGQAELAVRLARNDADQATAKRAALSQADDAATRARKARSEAHQLLQSSQASLSAAETLLQSRLASLQFARNQRTLAETRLRAVLRAETARSAATRRQEISARLASIAGVTTELARHRKGAATGPDAKAIAALEFQVQEVAVLTSLRARSATQIAIAYSGPQRVSLDGAELAESTMHPILSDSTLDLPGLGRLTIHPSDAGSSAARLAQAETELAALLARTGCATVEAARAAAKVRAEAISAVKDIETRISTLAPKGIAALEAELSQLPEPVAEDPGLPTAPQAQQALDDAMQALDGAERATTEAQARAEQDRLAEARASVSARAADATLAAAEADLAAFGDLILAAATLSTRQAEAASALSGAQDKLSGLAANAPDFAQAEAALSRATSVVAGADEDNARLTAERTGLDREIDLRSGEGVAEDLADVSTRLLAAQTQRDRLLFEVSVLKTLIAALESARDTARERYFAPVMAELKPLLRLLWPDAELKFDGESLLPTALVRNGLVEDIGILSGGTQEQIALFVRLAFGRLLARTGRHAPVILDDALVYTDDDRIERVFDALHGQAHDLQIIVLSCRQRAFRDLGGHKLTFAPVQDMAAQ